MLLSTLCYIQKDGRTLLLHRTKKKDDVNSGKWIGIGGKPEPGESPLDCVMREAKEESGLTLIDPVLRGVITFASDKYETEYMFLYVCRDYNGTPAKDCDEGVLEWVEDEKIDSLPLWEGDRVFLPLIKGERPFFCLKLIYLGDRLTEARFE